MNLLEHMIEEDLNTAVTNAKVMNAVMKAVGLPTLAESLKPVEPANPPLCRFGPGGEFVKDYTPKL